MKTVKSKWAQAEPLDRSTTQTARVFALWQAQQEGLIDLSSYGSKGDLAKKLGISRWTLDRSLEVLDEATKLAKEVKLALISERNDAQMNDGQFVMLESMERTIQAEGLLG